MGLVDQWLVGLKCDLIQMGVFLSLASGLRVRSHSNGRCKSTASGLSVWYPLPATDRRSGLQRGHIWTKYKVRFVTRPEKGCVWQCSVCSSPWMWQIVTAMAGYSKSDTAHSLFWTLYSQWQEIANSRRKQYSSLKSVSSTLRAQSEGAVVVRV